MAKRKKSSLDLTKPVERPRMPLMVLLRMFVIGAVGVAASGYAIYRHYYIPRPSMLEPVPPATPTASWSPDLVPVPDLVPLPPPRPLPPPPPR